MEPPGWLKALALALSVLVTVLIVVPIACVGLSALGHDARDSAFSLLWNDIDFRPASFRTLSYATLTTCLQLAMGYVLALIVYERRQIMGRYRYRLLKVVLLSPYFLLIVVSTRALRVLVAGLPGDASADTFAWLVMLSVWQYFPFVFLLLLAALEDIPVGQINVALVENPAYVSRFAHVLFPSTWKVLLAVGFIRWLWMFTKFEPAYFLVELSPHANDGLLLPTYIYRMISAGEVELANAAIVLVLAVEVVGVALLGWYIRKAEVKSHG